MSMAPPHPRDPFGWNLLVALTFAALAAVRLTIPSAPYFDEVHYLPAVRELMNFGNATNIEHPPLAKEIMAIGVWLFGDEPLGWRVMSLAFGTLALFSAMRAMWFASCSRAVSVLTGLFVASNFHLFVHSRIAMLDVFMVGFTMLALWMSAAAARENETARWRLGIAGVALGAAMACKWNAVPVAVVPGSVFLVARVCSAKGAFLTARRGWPIGGMTLWEAVIWLGAVPLIVYGLSFWPYPHYTYVPYEPQGLIELHKRMLEMQTQVPEPHPYQSQWWQWIFNGRVVWYLYEAIDGAQRGIMLIGNPLTMLAGLPALIWCGWAGIRQNRKDCAGVALLYVASFALWIVAPKPVQFYFHYFLPAMFLSAALALATERLWQRGARLLPAMLVLGALGLFAYWSPILTAAPLEDSQDFLRWAWIEVWR